MLGEAFRARVQAALDIKTRRAGHAQRTLGDQIGMLEATLSGRRRTVTGDRLAPDRGTPLRIRKAATARRATDTTRAQHIACWALSVPVDDQPTGGAISG
ncbi:Uncharacterised protein [Mycobacteroides abscessus subsp. abscessus]|nr:Uncharacterised protein [Mycobacteroides abscessus subsp. abscessus]